MNPNPVWRNLVMPLPLHHHPTCIRRRLRRAGGGDQLRRHETEKGRRDGLEPI